MAAYVPKLPLAKYKREAMTQEQLLEHKRKLLREAQKRCRKKAKKADVRARRTAETTKCYDWEKLLPHIRKEESGCWVWTGPFRRLGHHVRPFVHAGALGRARADIVVVSLSRKKPLPYRCFVTTSCGRIECVAPDHLLVTNTVVERAKKREGAP